MSCEDPRRAGGEDTRLRTTARERESRNQRLGRNSGRRHKVPVLNGSARTTANSDESNRQTTTRVQGRGHRYTLNKVRSSHGHVPGRREGRDNPDDWEMEKQVVHEVLRIQVPETTRGVATRMTSQHTFFTIDHKPADARQT